MSGETAIGSAQGAVGRRAFLAAAAGGAATLGSAALPAWARAATQPKTARRRPDSLPFPHLPPGTPTMHRIEHIVVVMMENHSFDNLLGMVAHQVPGREAVDGLTLRRGRPVNFNRDAAGRRFHARRSASPCQLPGRPSQAWNASHESWNHGRNDGFVRAGGPVAMSYWDRTDLPFTYSLVEHFPFGERFFSSSLAQTYPNRRFLFTGTASGTTATDGLTGHVAAAHGTIFDRLDASGIDFRIYYEDLPSWLIVPGILTAPGRASRQHRMDRFYADAAAGRLPRLSFLDPNYTTTSQENPQDIQVGERFIAKVVQAVMHAPTWRRTALFITYDEHGGYYDHVPPPRAVRPDSIAPIQEPSQPRLAPGTYDRYGFRVPSIVVSPWARAGYTSRRVQDLTSITAFIEHKWNLPAMTFRDANAHPMTDYFDFRRPSFGRPPELDPRPGLNGGLARCRSAGLTPPKARPGTLTDIARYLKG